MSHLGDINHDHLVPFPCGNAVFSLSSVPPQMAESGTFKCHSGPQPQCTEGPKS